MRTKTSAGDSLAHPRQRRTYLTNRGSCWPRLADSREHSRRPGWSGSCWCGASGSEHTASRATVRFRGEPRAHHSLRERRGEHNAQEKLGGVGEDKSGLALIAPGQDVLGGDSIASRVHQVDREARHRENGRLRGLRPGHEEADLVRSAAPVRAARGFASRGLRFHGVGLLFPGAVLLSSFPHFAGGGVGADCLIITGRVGTGTQRGLGSE